jgi:2-dehydro-3-deoxyphosphogluconate aldolase/(4S)-4-hydroxy-2-oxoglutarate aldolase
MQKVLDTIKSLGVIPVVVLDDVKDAPALAQALLDAELPLIEITLRTAQAYDIIRTIRQQHPDMCIGAGTVLQKTDVDHAIQVGADYLISPGFNPEVVAYAHSKNIIMIPGVNNPSHIEQARAMGIKIMKFFPAEQSGGQAMLKSLMSIYPDVMFIPTGGIDAGNISSYARLANVYALGGSWMVSADLLRNKQWQTITQKTRQAIQELHDFQLAHIGINQSSDQQASQLAQQLGHMFHMQAKDGPKGIFVGDQSGDQFEIMKAPFHGHHGHIAISCNHVERARAYFEAKGFIFRTDFLPSDAHGLKAIYFEGEWGGFALHLTRKP